MERLVSAEYGRNDGLLDDLGLLSLGPAIFDREPALAHTFIKIPVWKSGSVNVGGVRTELVIFGSEEDYTQEFGDCCTRLVTGAVNDWKSVSGHFEKAKTGFDYCGKPFVEFDAFPRLIRDDVIGVSGSNALEVERCASWMLRGLLSQPEKPICASPLAD